jgi:hypothetical protein
MRFEKIKSPMKIRKIFLPILIGFSLLIIPTIIAENSQAVANFYNYTFYTNITHEDRTLTIANRVVDNGPLWASGTTMAFTTVDSVTPNYPYYLIFNRKAVSHAGVGDYGVMDFWRSSNSGFDYVFVEELVNVTHRDIRNYAAGEHEGWIVVTYSIYDCDNDSFYPELYYKVSGDRGSHWSVQFKMDTRPTFQGFIPYTQNTFNHIRVNGLNELGMMTFCYNATNYTQLRYTHSQPLDAITDYSTTGFTWTDEFIYPASGPWSLIPPFAPTRTEGDNVYVGNNKIVALTRQDSHDSPELFTSTDNGRNWHYWGGFNWGLAGSTMETMDIVTDNMGEKWVFAVLYQGSTLSTTYGNIEDMFTDGVNAFVFAKQTSQIWGGFPFLFIVNQSANSGQIFTTFSDTPQGYTLAFDIQIAIIKNDIAILNVLSLTWMLVIFFPALVIAQIIPKIGFGFALGLMLIVVETANGSFFPEMIIGLVAVGTYIWKGD